MLLQRVVQCKWICEDVTTSQLMLKYKNHTALFRIRSSISPDVSAYVAIRPPAVTAVPSFQYGFCWRTPKKVNIWLFLHVTFVQGPKFCTWGVCSNFVPSPIWDLFPRYCHNSRLPDILPLDSLLLHSVALRLRYPRTYSVVWNLSTSSQTRDGDISWKNLECASIQTNQRCFEGKAPRSYPFDCNHCDQCNPRARSTSISPLT